MNRKLFLSLVIVLCAVMAIAGCKSSAASDTPAPQPTPSQPQPTPEPVKPAPQPVTVTPAPAVTLEPIKAAVTTTAFSEEFKMKIFALIRDRKFFEAYQELNKIQPANDWVIAHKIFVAYALKKLEDSGVLTKNPDSSRTMAKQLAANGQHEAALEIMFTIEPKTDDDIAMIMQASHNLFKESGGQQITRYLAAAMIGFLHARSNKNDALEAKTEEAVRKIDSAEMQPADQEKYKQALVQSASFFKEIGNSFEDLLLRHLEKSGYSLLDIQAADADKRQMLADKANEGDTYSKLYLTWYDSYRDFNQIVNKLLIELSLK